MAEAIVARLERVVDHGNDTRSLFLGLEAPLVHRPGQFVSCLLRIGDDEIVRPYSIASAVGSTLEFLLNRVPGGVASAYLFSLEPGAVLRLTGPWGGFALDRAPAAETIFVAEETGIAPIRPMLHRAAATAAHPLHLLYGATAPLFQRELAAIPGLVVEHLDPALLWDTTRTRYVEHDTRRDRHFFICGTGKPVYDLRDALRGAGYPRRNVQYEKW